jgi:hypothetical protein
MSHDIGALGDALVIATKAMEEARLAYQGAARMAVLSAFGEANWGGGGFQVIQGEYNERWVHVCHDARQRAWVATASATLGHPHDRATPRAFADTPRAAVTAALETLALTHPTEAAALAAVIPPEKP